ncbi:NUDIX domain-containing protein [Bacillus massiliigorillae]|uniref:NUDIX domain-containing protein n=1 Tax=Bacillus massiliigorillae TaxID=1243664 RepID=UPI0003A6826F|nr:NUDIX domain-containing protein [Bacillus massiliigorillae]
MGRQTSVNKEHINIKCGIIIEKEDKILLQRNPGENYWSLPGGMMQLGEKYEETAIRGVLEETALTIETVQLFGMLSGRDCFVTNKFGEKAFILQVVFFTTEFTGKVKIKDEANREHRFYKRTNLPKNLNPQQKAFITDWKEQKPFPIIN